MIWSYIIIFSPPEHRKHHLNLKWGDLIVLFRPISCTHFATPQHICTAGNIFVSVGNVSFKIQSYVPYIRMLGRLGRMEVGDGQNNCKGKHLLAALCALVEVSSMPSSPLVGAALYSCFFLIWLSISFSLNPFAYTVTSRSWPRGWFGWWQMFRIQGSYLMP